MRIMVRTTKLFYAGHEGEAPAGTTREFDLLEHKEFLGCYGHCPLQAQKRYAQEQVERWNRMQPTNWKYELLG